MDRICCRVLQWLAFLWHSAKASTSVRSTTFSVGATSFDVTSSFKRISAFPGAISSRAAITTRLALRMW